MRLSSVREGAIATAENVRCHRLSEYQQAGGFGVRALAPVFLGTNPNGDKMPLGGTAAADHELDKIVAWSERRETDVAHELRGPR